MSDATGAPNPSPGDTVQRPVAPVARPERPAEPTMPAPIPIPPVDVDEPLQIELSFWRRPWVQVVLPIVSSIAINGGLLLLAVVFYSSVTLIYHAAREQVIVPEARIIEGGDPGTVPHAGFGIGQGRLVTSDLDDAEEHFTRHSQQLTHALSGEDAEAASVGQVIGFGAAQAATPGTATPDRRLRTGGVLDSMPFGVPGGAEVVPLQATLLGVSGNAVRIAFICDGSSSMVDRMPALRFELRETISRLKPVQAFNIIFFQQGGIRALSQGPLLMASDENLEMSLKFLNEVTLKPNSDPTAALELAFAQRAQLIFLLSDGEFVDNAKVIQRIRELNKDKRTTINTIAIVSNIDATRIAQDEQKAGIEDLKRIADENGGTFKRVSMRNLR